MNRQAVKWRPKARLIRTIGDEIVSSPKVALLELVKNAYDADATRVMIRLSGAHYGETPQRLEILDDGTGMTRDVILDDWLVPATPSKKRRTRTPRGRRVLGEKGVGRFAAARLGSKLEMVTRAAESHEEIVVRVDWDAFANDEAFLDEIPIELEERDPQVFVGGGNSPCHGTLVRISDLAFKWDKDFEASIVGSLERLVSPFTDLADFTIVLDQDGAVTEIQPSEIVRNPMYQLRGRVGPDGRYEIELTLPDGAKVCESGTVQGEFTCGPFSLEIRAWDRDPDSLRPFAERLNRSVEEIRHALDLHCGISVYRDGFRVLPYGERGNDWLGLDLRSRLAPTTRFANNQVVGIVEVSADDNPALLDQTNREGIRDSKEFREFRMAILQLLTHLETARTRFKRQAKLKPPLTKDPGDPLSVFRLGDLVNYVRETHPADRVLLETVTRAQRDVLLEAKRLRETQARFARLATLGGLIDRLLHEGRRPLSLLRMEAQNGAKSAFAWPDPYGKEASARFRKIDEHAGVIAAQFERLEPLATRKRGRPKAIPIESIARRAVQFYGDDLKRYRIEVGLPDSETFVTADEAEIETVFTNLLDNSIYWLQQIEPPRRIVILVERERDNSVTVLFSDNGPGVPEEHRRYIFEPYYSTKPNGVGLGLYIAALIIADYYGGEIELVSGGPLPGATFRFTLRRRTG